MTTIQATELQYTQGSSSKFYRVFAGPDSLTTAYGRIGSYGTVSTALCADPAKAAAKAVASKIAKGYVVVRRATLELTDVAEGSLACALDGVPMGQTDGAPVLVRPQSEAAAQANTEGGDPAVYAAIEQALSGLVPARTPSSVVPAAAMLATTVDTLGAMSLLSDPTWLAQVKLDGDRVLVKVQGGVVSVLNRNGQPKVTNIGPAHLAPFRHLTHGDWLLDGEIVEGRLHLFDLGVAASWAGPDTPYRDRLEVLTRVVKVLLADDQEAPIALIATISGAERAEFVAQAREQHREGVIFRDAGSRYQVGRSDSLLKLKFVRTVDAVVTSVGAGGKATARLGVYSAGQLIDIGAVSTLGKGQVEIGDIVEVRFLYVNNPAHPVLFQPTIVRVRTDKSAAQCGIDQLDEAGTDRSVATS